MAIFHDVNRVMGFRQSEFFLKSAQFLTFDIVTPILHFAQLLTQQLENTLPWPPFAYTHKLFKNIIDLR